MFVAATSPLALKLLLCLATGAYAAWNAVHMHIGYARRFPTVMHVNAVCGAVLALATALLLASDPSAGSVAGISAALFVMALLTTGATAVAGRPLGGGTAWARSTPAIVAVEEWLQPHRAGFGRPVLALLHLAAPTRDASCFVVSLLILLAACTGGAAANITEVHVALHLPGGAWGGRAVADAKHPAAQAPRAATRPEVVAARQPSYEAVCAGHPSPGDGAPEPQASLLRALWLGGHGHDGVGAGVAGCAERATESDARAGTYVAEGWCGSELRSLAVVTPDGKAAIALGQVAAFADEQLRRGTLLEASARTKVQHGDMQVIRTTDGSWVLVRARSSNGTLASDTPVSLCKASTDVDAPYTVVSPGAVRPWAITATAAWTWPYVTPSGGYAFRTSGGAPVASIVCATPLACSAGDSSGVTGSAADSDAAADALLKLAGG